MDIDGPVVLTHRPNTMAPSCVCKHPARNKEGRNNHALTARRAASWSWEEPWCGVVTAQEEGLAQPQPRVSLPALRPPWGFSETNKGSEVYVLFLRILPSNFSSGHNFRLPEML